MTHNSSYKDLPIQTGTVTISTVNYCETIFENPELTKIIGAPAYDNPYLRHNKIKPNKISLHSNIGGGQHGYIGLVVIPNYYALLSNTIFVRPIKTGTLTIPVVATCHAQDKLKRQYDKNI